MPESGARTLKSQLRHARLEGGGFEPQSLGGAPDTANPPPGAVGGEQIAVIAKLEQCAPIEIKRLDDAVLSLLDCGVHVGGGQIDEPHRQFADEALEIEPLLVRRTDNMSRSPAFGNLADRGGRKEAAATPDRIQADSDGP